MSKKIDYDKIVRDSFAKAQQDLGFKKSILSETDGVTSTSFSVPGGGKTFGKQVKNPSPVDLSYFTKRLRDLSGVGSAEANKVSVSDLKKILIKLTDILGYEEADFGGAKAGYIKEKAATANVSEITTALFVANTIRSIIFEQQATTAGSIWEGFIANLIYGSLPTKLDRPIEDVVDEQGNLISLKLLKSGGGVEGSRWNLAVAIAQKGQVTYLVCEKNVEETPFVMRFHKFVVNKDNFFQFAFKDAEVLNKINNENEAVYKFIDAIKKDIKVQHGKKGKKEEPAEDKDEDTGKGASRVRSVDSFEDAIEQHYIDSAEAAAGGKDAPEEKKEAEREKIRNEFRQEISKLADESWKNIELFKRVFGDVLKDDNTLHFDKTKKTISLKNEAEFKKTMQEFWIANPGTQKIFQTGTVYQDYMPKIIKGTFIFPIDTDDEQSRLDIIKKYEQNPKEQIYPKIQDLDNKLAQIHNEFCKEVGENPNQKFEDLYKKFLPLKESSKQTDAAKYESSVLSFNKRLEIYREKHAIFARLIAQILKQFVSWQETVIQKARASRKAYYGALHTAIASASSKVNLNDFWTAAAQRRQDASGGTRPGGSFKIGMNAIVKFIDVDDDFSPIILSKIQAGQLVKQREDLFKKYIKPYYDLLKEISENSNTYFVGDDTTGLTKTDQSLAKLSTLIQGSTYKADTGGAYKKASELTETLKLTKEAAMVMEMLKRMED